MSAPVFPVTPEALWTRVPAALRPALGQLARVDGAAGRGSLPVYLSDGGQLEVLTGALVHLFGERFSSLLPVEAVRQAVTGMDLRDYQADAVVRALTAPGGRGIIEIAMGGGKTRIAVAIAHVAARLGLRRWLYLVQNKSLAEQTEASAAELAERFGGRPEFVPTTYAGVAKYGSLECDGILVDECHLLPTPTRCLPFAKVKARFRIGLSGTSFDRQDGRNAVTLGLLGPKLCSIDVARLEEAGHLTRGKVLVLSYSRLNGGRLQKALLQTPSTFRGG